MAKSAVIAVSLALLTATSSVGAEEDNATLKAENLKLQRALAGGAQVRKLLYQRINDSKAENNELTSKLSTSEIGREYFLDKLSSTLSDSKSTISELQTQLASAEAGRNHLREKVLSTLGKSSEWASSVSSSLNASVGGYQGTEVTTGSDDSVNIRLGNTGLFRTGGALISGNGNDLISRLAVQLKNHSDATITVIGHTDNIPVGSDSPFSNNSTLSFARAQSTLQALKTAGVPIEQLSAAGYGANYPIADNQTVEGRQQNRRVELVLRAK